MDFRQLPLRAAYIIINHSAKRNVLSRQVLQDLRSHLHRYLTSPVDKRLLLLPKFKASILDQLEKNRTKFKWLVDAREWNAAREGLPNVLVLRSEGPDFSVGHDLRELQQLSQDAVKENFNLWAEVMSLIRRSPALVICLIQGLATAAGFQLAMSSNFPIALAHTEFRLPGISIGLPCTSTATAVSRHLSPALTCRLLTTAEPIKASDMQGAVDVVDVPQFFDTIGSEEVAAELAFENRARAIVMKLTETAAQPQALGKWAYCRNLAWNEWSEQMLVGNGGKRNGMAQEMGTRKP